MNHSTPGQRVALLGLGAMGARMARRLLAAGYRVTVYNRTAARAETLVEAGARLARTPRAAAEAADVIIAMVTDDDASRAVWDDPNDGALLGLRPGAIALESSTVTPARIAELSRAVRARDAALLDAPVAGSRPQADAGALVHLVGGPDRALEAVRPLLSVMGQAVIHAGPVGAGAALKLAVNALFAVQVAAFAEVIDLLTRAGLERGSSIERLAALPVTSPAVAGVARLMAAADHAPQFPIDLVVKDLGYARDTAERNGGRAPLAAAAARVYGRASAAGLGGLNIAAVDRLYAEGRT